MSVRRKGVVPIEPQAHRLIQSFSLLLNSGQEKRSWQVESKSVSQGCQSNENLKLQRKIYFSSSPHRIQVSWVIWHTKAHGKLSNTIHMLRIVQHFFSRQYNSKVVQILLIAYKHNNGVSQNNIHVFNPLNNNQKGRQS